MRRDTISFEDFDKYFIQHPDGFFPVCAELKEDDEGNQLKVVQIDMICEWRLPDGKVKFLAVPFETQEQLDAIVAYLKAAADLLNKAILKNFSELSMPE